jgi:hypothetical protein
MTIFVSHPTGFSYDYKKELYEPLRNSHLTKQYSIILPHDSSSMPYETRHLFAAKKCDLVVAECSYHSTGQGIELGWADIFQIPVVCVSKKGTQELSGALKMITDVFFEYTDIEDMIKKIEEGIKRYA